MNKGTLVQSFIATCAAYVVFMIYARNAGREDRPSETVLVRAFGPWWFAHFSLSFIIIFIVLCILMMTVGST